MRTLSLDLRGRATDSTSRDGTNARGAGVSVLIHGLGLSALLLSPLLGAVEAPDSKNSTKSFLFVPTLTIPQPPPPPKLGSKARTSSSSATRQASVVLLQMKTPDSLPTTTEDVLDRTISDPGPGGQPGDPNGRDGQGGDCTLGALCGQLPAPTPEATKELVHVGGKIKEPRLISSQPPVFPEVARMARISGLVILEAHVQADGHVKDVRVLRSQTLFDEPAIAHVKTRRYEPLLLNGVPTEFLVTVTVAFTLR